MKLFGVLRATIKRYLKQRREAGQASRKPIPGGLPKKFTPLQASLRRQSNTGRQDQHEATQAGSDA